MTQGAVPCRLQLGFDVLSKARRGDTALAGVRASGGKRGNRPELTSSLTQVKHRGANRRGGHANDMAASTDSAFEFPCSASRRHGKSIQNIWQSCEIRLVGGNSHL